MGDYDPEHESGYARFVLHPNPQADPAVADAIIDLADERRKRRQERPLSDRMAELRRQLEEYRRLREQSLYFPWED